MAIRQRRPAEGPRVQDHPFASFNVIAEYRDMHLAQQAMQALGRAGIDGDTISLRGAPADEAADQRQTQQTDARILGHVARYAFLGALIGACIGAITSPLAGWAVLSLTAEDISPRSLAVALFLSVLAWSTAGALVGFVYSLQTGQPLELTFHDTSSRGRVYLGVHSDDSTEVRQAEQALSRTRHVDLYRVDAQGRRN
jgi:hypothetical protein